MNLCVREKGKRTVQAVEIFRAIAVMFVMNSHYEHVYPLQMDAGGELGLAIFFLLTGYLLTNIKPETRFLPWFAKRFVRIYIPFLVFTLLDWALGYFRIDSLSYAFAIFVWPMDYYWFAGHIILLYIVFYIYRKLVYQKFGNRGTAVTMILVFLPAVVAFVMRMTYYRTYATFARLLWLLCMLLGAYIHDNEKKLTATRRPAALSTVLAISMAGYIAGKFMVTNGKLVPLWITPFLCCIVFAYAGLVLCLSYESLCERIMQIPVVGTVLGMMSAASLEIYFIQVTWIKLFTHIMFPVNWIMITAANIITGYWAYRLLQLVIRPICAKLPK